MKFETTTTLAALDNFATLFGVGSSLDMRSPLAASGRRTYLKVDEEMMHVEAVPGPGLVLVQRGALGSLAIPHQAGAVVEIVGENYGVDYG